MGNKIISGDQSLDISLNHPKISTSTLITNFDRSILRLKIPCDDQGYKLWKKQLDINKNLSHENLLLPLSHKFIKQGICATRGQVEIDFPAYPFLLNSEIKQRKIKSIQFTQPQLWYLIFALLSVSNYLSSIKNSSGQIILGDIRPQNIFISQNGFVKFVNLISWPDENNGYSKGLQGVVTYLSPEDMELIQLGKINNNNSYKKSQDFSIGMTMLSSALLVDNSDLYDLNKKSFNSILFNKRLYQLIKNTPHYSELLKSVIYGLCGQSPEKRLISKQLYIWLRAYQKQISRKQPFVVDQLPKNINQKIKEMKSLSFNDKIQGKNQLSSISNLKSTQKSPTSSISERKNNLQSFQTRQVVKSSQGYYSPRSHTNLNGQPQQYKVFIQYKSPTKEIVKPYTQTVYENSDKKNKQSPKFSNIKVQKQTILKEKQSQQITKEEKIVENINKTDQLDNQKQNNIKDKQNEVIQSPIKIESKRQNDENIKIMQAQTSIIKQKALTVNQEQKKQLPSIAKQLTDTVRQLNTTLLLQTKLKHEEQLKQEKPVKDQQSNQHQQNKPQPQQQLVPISFPVVEHHIKINSRKTLVESQKPKLTTQDPQYFSLIQPMVPVKKVIKKKQPPVILYDCNSKDKIIGFVWDHQQKTNNHNINGVQEKDNKIASTWNVQMHTQNGHINQQNQKKVSQQLTSQQPKRLIPSQTKDFLDEVMNVNKIINHQQEKDYQKDNKYLNNHQ